jgi:hypothetical protein
MSEQKLRDLPAQEETAEIELSGDDLKVLSRANPSTASAEAPAAAATDISSRPITRVLWRWPVALACAGAVSLAAIGAGYRVNTSNEVAARAALMEQLNAVTPSVQAQPVYAEPVRVRNPFDKGEVFEFPAGTSEQDARDAMADMLLKRAMERQAAYDAKHPRRKSRR